MKKFLKFLQSNQAVLMGAVLALSTQLWHSVRAFVLLDVGGSDNYWNYLFGILFSVSTSFAILLFTVRGRKGWAYFFLAVEVFINVIHYSVLDMPLGPILFATIFMCLIVPVTISIYSSEIDVNTDEMKAEPIYKFGIDLSDKLDTPEISKTLTDKYNQYSNASLAEKMTDKKEVIFPSKMNEAKPKAEIIFADHSMYDGQPNIQSISAKEASPLSDMVKRNVLDSKRFVKEVNDIIGFDITNPKDKSGDVPEYKKAELRKLYKEREGKSEVEILEGIKSILNQKGPPLFN